jgi:hypothetical protein
MSETKIYLDLSTEIQELLADNEISIADILQQENIEVTDVTEGVMPDESEDGARSKDLVPIIVASAALAPEIGFLISQTLNNLGIILNDIGIKITYKLNLILKGDFVIKFHAQNTSSESEDEGND